MPTRKQRRRRAKDKRHEWEYVVVDEEGQEVEVKPSELRTKPDRADRNGSTARSKSTASKPANARARNIRPAKPPSLRRAATRAILFAAVLFVFTSFVAKGSSNAVSGRLFIAVLYGLVAIPFFYFLDRATYNRYLKATGRESEIQPLRRRR